MPEEASMQTTEFDSIDNQRLIANGLQHMAYELSLPEPSYFRIAREAHQVLYRSMIEALKGTANLEVTGWAPKNIRFQERDGAWLEIHREKVVGCDDAWVYSIPAASTAPEPPASRKEEGSDRLIGFFDALAMIQCKRFMSRLTMSKPVPVALEAIQTLEWLYKKVRHEYEHFIPKSYASPIQELLDASEVCVRLSHELIFASGTVFPEASIRRRLQRLFTMLAIRRQQRAF